MWPFQPRYSEHIQILAHLLDTVLLDYIEKLKVAQGESFLLELRKDSKVERLNVEALDLHGVSPSGVSWCDKRLSGFIFSVNFNDEPWAISALWNDGHTTPALIGIMVGTNPIIGSTESITKWVSVEDWMQSRATSAARALGELLSSKHQYRLFKP